MDPGRCYCLLRNCIRFLLSRQRQYPQEVQQEKNLNIQLNRGELENLELIDGPIYVVGHQSPDSDTVCSSIVYANLLTQLGYDAQPAVLGKINNETAYILKYAGVPVPEILEDASGKNVILMDHSENLQTAEGVKDAHIVSIIDHHGDGTVTTANPLIYDARPIGAMIWLPIRPASPGFSVFFCSCLLFFLFHEAIQEGKNLILSRMLAEIIILHK